MRQIVEVMVKNRLRHEWLRRQFNINMSQYQARLLVHNENKSNGEARCTVTFTNLDTGAKIEVKGVRVNENLPSQEYVVAVGRINLTI